MRELKFRAWDKKQKKMLYGVSIGTIKVCDENAPFISHEFSYSEDCIFEQYTGLKDKNGKEIYEGDIVKIYRGRKLDGVFLVQFDGPNGEYVWCKNEDIDSARYGGFPYWAKYLVIGNIHENPELLGNEE